MLVSLIYTIPRRLNRSVDIANDQQLSWGSCLLKVLCVVVVESPQLFAAVGHAISVNSSSNSRIFTPEKMALASVRLSSLVSISDRHSRTSQLTSSYYAASAKGVLIAA